MSAGQPLIRVRETGDPWVRRDRLVSKGVYVARSGRVLEDVAAPPLSYRRGDTVCTPPAQTPDVEIESNTSAEPEWAMPRYRDADAWRRPADAPDERARPSLSHLHRCVVLLTGVPRDEILGRSQKLKVCKARFILAWLLQKQGNRSLPSIGASLGGRDHTSALNAVCRVNAAIAALGIDPDAPTTLLIEALWAGKWPDKRRGQA